MKRKYVVMEFHPEEGMHLYGVFDTAAHAQAWIDEVGGWRMPVFVMDVLDHEDILKED